MLIAGRLKSTVLVHLGGTNRDAYDKKFPARMLKKYEQQLGKTYCTSGKYIWKSTCNTFFHS